MKEISFEEVQHLIPEIGGRKARRTRYDVHREYNDEKYSVLKAAKSFEEALALYRGPVRDMIVSRHDRFYVMPSDEAWAMREKLIIETLSQSLENVDTVVELGAGFGQTLEAIRQAYPRKQYIAGEFSKEARELGVRLLPDITFVEFDFYDEVWPLLTRMGEKSLVLSFHAIEMVRDANMVAQKLRESGANTISLFEPVYELGKDPIRTARRSYIEKHDYCRNIEEAFSPSRIERDFFGINPFFPEAHLSISW